MTYRIIIETGVRKVLRKLPQKVQRRIIDAVRGLRNDPRPLGCRKLVGWENAWRIRVGDYRVIYEVRDDVLLVMIIEVGHRSSVYR